MDGHTTTPSPTAAYDVGLLVDWADLVEVAVDLPGRDGRDGRNWRDWRDDPEPAGRDWWLGATAVGLGRVGIDERRGRSPRLLGLIVRPDRRSHGVGRRLPTASADRAACHGHDETRVSDEGQAADFYVRCGWAALEVVDRTDRREIAMMCRRSGDMR